MNKRGINLIYGAVIFLILNAIFFGAMFAFVFRATNDASLHEQVLAKEIALLIDGAKPGTLISLNLENVQKFIEKNDISESEVVIVGGDKVNVKLTRGSGYSFMIFSDYKVDRTFVKKGDDLILNLQIMENDE